MSATREHLRRAARRRLERSSGRIVIDLDELGPDGELFERLLAKAFSHETDSWDLTQLSAAEARELMRICDEQGWWSTP